MLLYELRIRARVTRLAKFTIDLSDVEPEVAGRDAILSQKAAVRFVNMAKGSGGRGGGGAFLDYVVKARHVVAPSKLSTIIS